MKILVTGVLGFIGSHFARLAATYGAKVYGLDALTYAANWGNVGDGSCEQVILGRIEDAETVRDCLSRFRPTHVVNFAAETHVTRSIVSPSEFLVTNVVGSNVLFDQCAQYWLEPGSPPEFRVLHVSTDEVYGSLEPQACPWTPLSRYAPNNPYAASKAASDHLARAYFKTYGLPIIVTHSANNYGPGQHPEKLLPALIRKCLQRIPMAIHGDGRHVRDWLHVKDHCEGLWKALTTCDGGEVLNFGGECERTNLQVASMVGRHMAIRGYGAGTKEEPVAFDFVADRPGNDRRYSMCNSRTAKRLQWSPGPSIEDRISDVIQWYIDNPNYADNYGK